ncbi:MAG TPA: carbon-nitrogen hydrolase family protein, partial [bacterium]|nr:carbon-nitrogen hydrolase family protein [bacterium]
VFTIKSITFGISICHEGWRYPETVRWPVVRGAQIVFQPQYTGSHKKPCAIPTLTTGGRIKGKTFKKWGESFYEKAMMCRSQENSIYFASVNMAMRFQNSATSLIDPDGNCIAYVPYGMEKLLIQDIDLSKATRFYARKFHPEWYTE